MLRNGLLALLLAGGLVACGDTPPEAGIPEEPLPPGIEETVGSDARPQTLAEATSRDANVALWRLTDADTAVYLVGTLHLMQQDVDWQTDAIRAAFRQADAVFLEADVFSQEAQTAMGVVVTETSGLKEGTLSGFYSEEQRARINEALAPFQMSLAAIDGYRPWFAAMQVSLLSLIDAGGDPAAGADILIAREMLERGVPLRYLETAQQQIGFLASGEDERDAAYFLDVLDDLEEGEAYYADLLAAWYEGDTQRLDFLVNGAMNEYPELKTRLLDARNEDWAGQIDRLMNNEPGVFVIAVGAGHLVGDASLQSELRERGYKVERL